MNTFLLSTSSTVHSLLANVSLNCNLAVDGEIFADLVIVNSSIPLWNRFFPANLTPFIFTCFCSGMPGANLLFCLAKNK